MQPSQELSSCPCRSTIFDDIISVGKHLGLLRAIIIWAGSITYSDMYFLNKGFVFRTLCHRWQWLLTVDGSRVFLKQSKQ